MQNTSEQSTNIKQKKSLAKTMMEALSSDGRFFYYTEKDYRVNKDESKSISQFAFYDLAHKIENPDDAIQLSFVLQTVHGLGHATRNMILDYLMWQHRMYPEKFIPAVSDDIKKNQTKIGKLIKKLLDRGLLIAFDYVTKVDRKHIVVYACTQYGWIFYRNKLAVQTNYDTNAVFRADVEVLKRLATASVATSLSRDARCTGIHMNDRYGSTKYRDIGAYTYGIAEFNNGGENGNLVLLEPVFYRFNPKITTESENNDKIIKRLENLEKAVAQLQEKYNTTVQVCYIVEDNNGLFSLFNNVQQNYTSRLFGNAIYTSDNIICASEGDINKAFLKVTPADDGKYKIVPAKDKWLDTK